MAASVYAARLIVTYPFSMAGDGTRIWLASVNGACTMQQPVTQTSTDSPGVHFPPPLFYAGAVIAGWLLDRTWPLPIDRAWRTDLGWVFVAG